MKSLNLLPALRKLPTKPSSDHRSFRDIITDLTNTDRTFYAAEVASATSFGLWGVFYSNNLDDEMYSRLVNDGLADRLAQAYEMAVSESEAADQSLARVNGLEMTENGAMQSVRMASLSGLKGKLAEIEAAEEWLEQNGFTVMSLSLPIPTQHCLGYRNAVSPEGEQVFIGKSKQDLQQNALVK